MSKAVKEMMVTAIRDRIGDARDFLVVDSSRLDAITDNRMRLALQQKGITILRVKNTLAEKALSQLEAGSIRHVASGPSALVWGGDDAVALSKEIARWARELEPLEIKGASIDGQPLDARGVEALSKSPGRLELLSQLSGLLLSPGANLSAAILGPGATLQGQIKTLSEEKDEDEAEAEAA
jgi:large subunit ribosomal protein L10